MTRLPTVFVSHGAPTLAIDDGPAHRFLGQLGKRFGKPRAILVLSAHFDVPTATITASSAPETIYDFSGFPEALYDVTYAAPGNPAVAQRVKHLLTTSGIASQLDDDRGFDHGAWVPLLLMYPNADVPVVQLSIDSRRGTAYHFRLGETLRPLREEGVLIIGSGGATHNLAHAFAAPQTAPLADWAAAFREWLADAVEQDRRDDIANYRAVAPYASRNHPTEEHLLPLICAVGATEPHESRQRVHASDAYGALAMDAYVFGAAATDLARD